MFKKDLSIYIHIPFCIKKCNYCDFLSCPATEEEIAYYLKNLNKEIRSYEPLSNLYIVKTIFFGGGTPSLLNEKQITELIDNINNTFCVDENAEITLECNPGTVTEKKLNSYYNIGINRLSIGLQSSDNNELECLGRIHRFKDFEETYYLARNIGFNNINIDIMSGIPGQTIKTYAKTLEDVISFAPEHISSYSLQLEEGTPFFEKYTNPLYAKELPDEKLDRDMYKYTKTFLESAGYYRYEISNYAKDGHECIHNTNYWTLKNYLGIGLGASSFFEKKRFANPRDFEEYKNYAMNAYSKLSNYEVSSKKQLMEEFMFLGLRLTKGISIISFEETFGERFSDIYGGIATKLFEMNMLDSDGDNMYLTDKGIDVSNLVLSNFILG